MMLRRCIFVKYLCGDLRSHVISLISILSYVYNHLWIIGRQNSICMFSNNVLKKELEM